MDEGYEERKRIADEHQRLEEEQNRLEEQRAIIEEKKLIEAEKNIIEQEAERLKFEKEEKKKEAERKRIEEKKKRIEEEKRKREIDKQKKEEKKKKEKKIAELEKKILENKKREEEELKKKKKEEEVKKKAEEKKRMEEEDKKKNAKLVPTPKIKKPEGSDSDSSILLSGSDDDTSPGISRHFFSVYEDLLQLIKKNFCFYTLFYYYNFYFIFIFSVKPKADTLAAPRTPTGKAKFYKSPSKHQGPPSDKPMVPVAKDDEATVKKPSIVPFSITKAFPKTETIIGSQKVYKRPFSHVDAVPKKTNVDTRDEGVNEHNSTKKPVLVPKKLDKLHAVHKEHESPHTSVPQTRIVPFSPHSPKKTLVTTANSLEEKKEEVVEKEKKEEEAEEKKEEEVEEKKEEVEEERKEEVEEERKEGIDEEEGKLTVEEKDEEVEKKNKKEITEEKREEAEEEGREGDTVDKSNEITEEKNEDEVMEEKNEEIVEEEKEDVKTDETKIQEQLSSCTTSTPEISESNVALEEKMAKLSLISDNSEPSEENQDQKKSEKVGKEIIQEREEHGGESSDNNESPLVIRSPSKHIPPQHSPAKTLSVSSKPFVFEKKTSVKSPEKLSITTSSGQTISVTAKPFHKTVSAPSNSKKLSVTSTVFIPKPEAKIEDETKMSVTSKPFKPAGATSASPASKLSISSESFKPAESPLSKHGVTIQRKPVEEAAVQPSEAESSQPAGTVESKLSTSSESFKPSVSAVPFVPKSDSGNDETLESKKLSTSSEPFKPSESKEPSSEITEPKLSASAEPLKPITSTKKSISTSDGFISEKTETVMSTSSKDFSPTPKVSIRIKTVGKKFPKLQQKPTCVQPMANGKSPKKYFEVSPSMARVVPSPVFIMPESVMVPVFPVATQQPSAPSPTQRKSTPVAIKSKKAKELPPLKPVSVLVSESLSVLHEEEPEADEKALLLELAMKVDDLEDSQELVESLMEAAVYSSDPAPVVVIPEFSAPLFPSLLAQVCCQLFLRLGVNIRMFFFGSSRIMFPFVIDHLGSYNAHRNSQG